MSIQSPLLDLPIASRSRPEPEPANQSDEVSVFPLTLTDVFWVALAVGLLTAYAIRIGSAPGIWDWPVLLLLPLAAIMADFYSGCIHWFFDTWGSERTFFIGPRMIKPFRVHHEKPKNLLATHFFTTNSDSAMGVMPHLLLLTVLQLALPLEWKVTQLVCFFLVAMAIFGMPTNQIHKWSHMSRPPLLVRWMQDLGLILGRKHHNVHHTPPHTTYYCITTGWCNPFLARINFWDRLERIVTKFTGLQPRAGEISK